MLKQLRNSRRLVLGSLFVATFATPTVRAIDLPPDAQVKQVHPGVISFRIERPDVPMAMYGFVWDLDQPDLVLRAVAANGKARTLQTTSGQVAPLATKDSVPIAACNADFYITTGPFTGQTVGPFMVDDELVRFNEKYAGFGVTDDGKPVISKLDVTVRATPPSGQAIEIPSMNVSVADHGMALYTPRWGKSTSTPAGTVEVALNVGDEVVNEEDAFTAEVIAPATDAGDHPLEPGRLILSATPEKAAALRDLKTGDRVSFEIHSTFIRGQPVPPLRQYVGGRDVLVNNGKVSFKPGPNEPAHPRTAIGYDDKQGIVLIVDGRAPGHSKGVTLLELAEILEGFHAKKAINLDGGGSSTCWVRGEIINRPSDGHERTVGNAIALVSTKGVGSPAQITFDVPTPILMAAGAAIDLKPVVTDERLNPISPAPTITLSTTGDLAIKPGERLAATSAGEGTVNATSGDVSGSLSVRVVDEVAKLTVEPSKAELLPGEIMPLRVEGRTAAGELIHLEGKPVDADADAGVSLDGLKVTGVTPGAAGAIHLRELGKQVDVPFAVARSETFIDLGGGDVHWNRVPEESAGGGAWSIEDADASGGRAVRLAWDFEKPTPAHASYLTLDKPLGRALGLRIRVRGDGRGERVYLRATLTDGNRSLLYLTIFDGVLSDQWQTFEVPLAKGMKQPATWKTLYVVSTDAKKFQQQGHIDIDLLEAYRVPDDPAAPQAE